MRTIENRIIAAIIEARKRTNFRRVLSERDRVQSDGTGKVEYYLWKTAIYTEYGPGTSAVITTGGWNTLTTASRLRALGAGAHFVKGRLYLDNKEWSGRGLSIPRAF